MPQYGHGLWCRLSFLHLLLVSLVLFSVFVTPPDMGVLHRMQCSPQEPAFPMTTLKFQIKYRSDSSRPVFGPILQLSCGAKLKRERPGPCMKKGDGASLGVYYYLIAFRVALSLPFSF